MAMPDHARVSDILWGSRCVRSMPTPSLLSPIRTLLPKSIKYRLRPHISLSTAGWRDGCSRLITSLAYP